MGAVTIDMPRDVRFILDKLNTFESTAYIVGGCVRDSIMGKTPHDWDICTSVMPSEVKYIFKDFKTIDTGIQHGTVSVLINNNIYEITTYRIDGDYEDFRHPTEVTFTDDIVNDLSRRDFTINAIAYNERHGIVDPFNGVSDIKNKIIRCVGNPNDRFNEDALRIFRAVRFAMTLGFKIQDETDAAMYNNRHLLKNIAMERINSELCKAIAGINTIDITLLRLLQVVMPKYFTEDVIYKMEFALSRIPTSGFVTLAFMCKVIADNDNSKIIHLVDMLKEMKFSKHDSMDIYYIYYWCEKCLDQILESIGKNCSTHPEVYLKYILRDCDETIAEKVMDLMLVCINANRFYAMRIDDFYSAMKMSFDKAKEDCHKLSMLKINGDDLLGIGVRDRDIGVILNSALECVITETMANDHDELMAYAMRYKKRKDKIDEITADFKVGDVVQTIHGFDRGLVAEVDEDGYPTRILSAVGYDVNTHDYTDTECQYGGGGSPWIKTGEHMKRSEWIKKYSHHDGWERYCEDRRNQINCEFEFGWDQSDIDLLKAQQNKY